MSNRRCNLVDAGLLIATGVDGAVRRGTVFKDVLMRLDAVIALMASNRRERNLQIELHDGSRAASAVSDLARNG